MSVAVVCSLALSWVHAMIERGIGCVGSQAAGVGVSPELVLQFMAWNAEAVARCEVLSPAGAAHANVRALFHSSTVQRACAGCLLEQVPHHTRLTPFVGHHVDRTDSDGLLQVAGMCAEVLQCGARVCRWPAT